MLGCPMGMGMAPELHPDVCRGSGKSFKWLILICLTMSLLWNMLESQPLALLMLGFPMGMAPELWPQDPYRKSGHTTLISVKNERGWMTKKALHSYQTDKQQCSMHMVTHHHLAGCAEQIRVLRRPKGSYPKFSSELWIFFIPTNFVVIGPLVLGQRPRRRWVT